MTRRSIRWLLSLLLLASASLPLRAEPRPDRKVNGALKRVEGVPVLRVWGSSHERGLAHGYLLADRIIGVLDGYLAAEALSGGPSQYEATVRRLNGAVSISQPYMEELRGMLAGVEKRLGGKTTVPRLGRNLTLADLVAVNCVPDTAGFGCSSFAAWGELTASGQTIAGRNLDWHTLDALRDTQVVIAHMPDKGDKHAAWISVTWPGLIICLTGMNEHGVTVSMHDVDARSSESPTRPTPRGFALRAALEAARPESAVDEIGKVLRGYTVLVGNNVPVAFPCENGRPASVVFEYDGNRRKGNGVTVRSVAGRRKAGKKSASFQIATNHYRKRLEAGQCGRYERLEKGLSQLSPGSLGVDQAWKLLEAVSKSGGLTTYHSVVFEPNARRLHVSFSNKTQSAPNGKTAALDAATLLDRTQ